MQLHPRTRRLLELLFGAGSSESDPQGETAETTVAGSPASDDGAGASIDVDAPESDAAPAVLDLDGEGADGDEATDAAAADAQDDGQASDGTTLAFGPGDGETGVVEGHAPPPDPVPFGDTVADRDERIEKYDRTHGHEQIRQRLRETGVAERIQHRLDRLFSGMTTQVRPRIRNERPATGPVGGRPDMRNVIRRFAGDLRVENVFERPEPGFDDDLAVGVVLDLSSSMSGPSEARAKEAAGAFLFGVQKFGGDVVALSYPRNMGSALITAPRERFRWEHLDADTASGGTPTSVAVEDGGELLAELSADSHLLLVLTDGGANNVNETRDRVEDIRDRGRNWSVVGFGYGDISERKLGLQFGDDGYRAVDLEALPDALVDVYREHHPAL